MTEPTADDLATLQARQEQLEAQLAALGDTIRQLVAKDVGRYLERETRWRWLQHVDFAQSMSDDQVRALKTDLKSLRDALIPEITEALGHSEVWTLPGHDAAAETSKSLHTNPRAWAILQQIACKLSATLSAHGFPPDPASDDAPAGDDAPPYQLVYQTPTYFIDGKYCPGQIETYWSAFNQLVQVRDAVAALTREQTRLALERRWATL